MRISIVIPVYNEADELLDCLQSVFAQKIPFYEIIVVDNGSDDGTAAMAAQFADVRVLHEPKRGVVHARNAGFSAARGDIIARIDADTRLPTDWTQQLLAGFTECSADVITGSVQYRSIAAARLVSITDLIWRRYMAWSLGSDVAAQGANMAIRRSTWRAIAKTTCISGEMHEDFDVAIHARKSGATVQFYEPLVASVSYRQGVYGFVAFARYALASPRTYLAHKRWRGIYMYQVVIFVITLYPIIALLARGYSQQTGEWSLARALRADGRTRLSPLMTKR